MTTNLTELEIRVKELEFQRAKLFIEFAKFGFSGTLTAAIAGMLLVLALAVLSAFTKFTIDTRVLLVMVFGIVVGCIAFGYFSLWVVPRIAARIAGMDLTFGDKEQQGK